MTYTEIKSYLSREDLISLLETLGYEFTRQGSFSIRDEKTPSTTIRLVDLYIKDHGGDFAGDIFDLLKELHSMTAEEGKNYVMNFLGLSSDPSIVPLARKVPAFIPKQKEQTTEEEEALINNLERMAAQCLKAFPCQKWSSFALSIDSDLGDPCETNAVSVAAVFEKLFEGNIIPTEERFAKYIFEKIVGYDSYFNCPVIIVRDESERVVDLVKYRPERDGKPLEQKYLVTANDSKPHKRGRNFVFPFQAQMMKIAHREHYCFVGEGLKNAVNASLSGIPFISIESSSNISQRLIEFLDGPRMKGIQLIGAMDGDAAGEKAYIKICDELHLSENMFDFNSGTDFTDYLKKLRGRIMNESKRIS